MNIVLAWPLHFEKVPAFWNICINTYVLTQVIHFVFYGSILQDLIARVGISLIKV